MIGLDVQVVELDTTAVSEEDLRATKAASGALVHPATVAANASITPLRR